jgi:hypothetical protein
MNFDFNMRAYIFKFLSNIYNIKKKPNYGGRCELGATSSYCENIVFQTKNTASELEAATGGTCLPLQCDAIRHYEVENMLPY